MSQKSWILRFDEKADRLFQKLSIMVQKRLLRYLKERVISSHDPRLLGEPMKGTMKEFWRYRVGDYRIICRIKDQKVTVLWSTWGTALLFTMKISDTFTAPPFPSQVHPERHPSHSS